MRLADYPDQTSNSTAIPFAADRTGSPAPIGAISPHLLAETRILQRFGFAKPLISGLLSRATRNGTSLETELLSCGSVRAEAYYEALAEILGLPFLHSIDPAHIVDVEGIDTQLVRPQNVRLAFKSQPPLTAIVPMAGRIELLQDTLERFPLLRTRLAVTTPQAMRDAVWSAGAARRSRETTRQLFERTPEHSARLTVWGRQGFYAGMSLSGALLAAATVPLIAIAVMHVILSLLFLSALVIRLSALFGPRRSGPPLKLAPPSAARPVYSVFVALYREADVARQLVGMLERLDWPRSRLDIKLICEADDAATLDVLRSLPLGPQFEIVTVPPGLPRTKPKALSYALPAARGEFLVVYDAEDRPHPGQLMEAWTMFRSGPAELACLQAPLVISNAGASWISALFALEYAALFRRLLPLLAAKRLPMPLGGTSNHFRTEVLKRCGGWDPHNVTEDADLGLRLYRMGYTCDTVDLPTLEDAPEDIRTWLGQRTRWFKGWLQTWLVLMRQPVRVVGEMGVMPFAVFQVLIGGLLLSSLTHPLLIAYVGHVAWRMAGEGPYAPGVFHLSLFVIDIANIFGSYAVFIALGRAPMDRRERTAVGWRWGLVAPYWMLISVAAWRAVAELRNKPFVWNKTAHRPTAVANGEETDPGSAPVVASA
ncbi:cellulose synthase/poly-beta-1,6-N-acetylglucosamine synthase-like glycosyltransferase [Mycoplana sp. BE70]|uniref:glycosyltransferase n=1 Tax=Mycoplana sp. BE70 TaxID=2817775 RepID=UPI002866B132|nr:glycosyltransferase [Mycoplana sp. BE70]MDR6754941.1 cellulose synthase/poly-beta-1,6-N-acetylglucosamine synthase-like glycosyltransferase [Mycoplana sp. BE70]